MLLERIYKTSFPGVSKYVMANGGTSDDACDIFQEAMMVVWINVREGKFRFLENGTLGGYIYQVARHKWLDHLKSGAVKKKSGLSIEQIEPDRTENEEEFYQQPICISNWEKNVKNYLPGFTTKKRSMDQIAEIMDHSPATVKTMKYRCMEKLRTLHKELKKGSSEI